VRLDRGILHGNNCPATQVDGHFPSECHHTAIEPVGYGILHENKRLATLTTDSSVLEGNGVRSWRKSHKGFKPPNQVVDVVPQSRIVL